MSGRCGSERRYAVVEVQAFILETDPDVVAEAFAALGLVVLKAEMDYCVDAFRYHVWSRVIPETKFGDSIPELDIIVSSDGFRLVARGAAEVSPAADIFSNMHFRRPGAIPKEVKL